MTCLLDWACLCCWFSLVWYDGLGTMMVLMLLLSRTRRSVVHPTWSFISDISSASDRVFPGFLGHFFGCLTPSKRGVLVHKNPVASCQRCRHSVEPRALTCPFKQMDLSAWSLLGWQPAHEYFWGRLSFVQICCLLSTVTVTPAESRIMSPEALLSKTVLVKFHTKAHVYDLAFRGVHAHLTAAVRNSWRRKRRGW